MSTSLADQLQRLAVPQTSVLKRDKKRASVLFTPKEAAGLKRETLYQIGLEGLEELISKNEVFDQFKNSLFHITSKDFERSVQDNEANLKLNKTIRKFLVLLSPYFLLNCSHKALEWLINRYSINEYNRDDILMLILPYHESNIFVKILQLLQFKESNDSFYFLKSLQKPGVHLPKKSLLQHAASDYSFLKFVTKYIMLLLKFQEKPNLLTVAFNFYCSVFVGAIEYSKNISENQVSQMLPLILKGLNSPIPDFCAASYIITAQLVAKSSFSNKLLDKFVEKLVDIKVPGLKAEMCLVLIVLYQSQKEYSDVPVSAVASLSEKEWLPKTLQDLNHSGSYIFPLLDKLMKRFAQEGINNNIILARDMVKNCLLQIKLEDCYIANIIQSILDAAKSTNECSVEINIWLTEIIEMLEKQYPNAFDQEIIKVLSITKGKKMIKRKAILSEILRNTMAYKGKFDVFEKLYHSHPNMRAEAIDYLKNNFSSLRETNQEIIKQSILDRLNDDDVSIVQQTFSIVHKLSIFEKDELKGILAIIAKKFRGKKAWKNISSSFIKLLNKINDPKDWKLFLVLFPCLLPRTKEDLTLSKSLINSSCVSENILLKSFIQKLHDISDEKEFVTVLLESLQNNNSWDNVKEFLEILNATSIEQRDIFHKYLASLILSHILPKNSPIDVTSLVLDILVTYYETSEGQIENKKSNILDYVDAATKEKFPTQGYLECLECVINKTSKQESNLSFIDFSEDHPARKYFVLLANILINGECYKTVTVFLDYFCPNWITKFNFLLNLCNSENKYFDNNFKKNTLNYLIRLSNDIEVEEFKQFIYIDKPTTSYLLILLADPSDDIRKLTFKIIELLIESSTRRSNSYFYLLEGIRKHKEEIVMDHEQISLIIFNILDPSNTKGKKHISDLNSIRNNLIKLICNEPMPIYIKSGILELLSHINTFDILEQITNVANEVFQKSQEVITGFEAIFIQQIITKIEAKIASKISFSTNTWNFIENVTKNCKTVISNQQQKHCTTALILSQLEKDFFKELEEEVEKRLLDVIIEISCIAENPDVLPAASRIFKHIDLDLNLVLEQLIKMRDVQSPKSDLTKRKRRVNVIPTIDILETLEWRKGVSVLEFIQDKKKIRNTSILLPVLFDILKKCLDFDEQTAVEYPKQLILSAILHCCLKMNDEVLPENVFNIELIVQCIRASQNPQTHHHALLLLAHAAQLLPSKVLHHMMAIFTFMGSSVLRHDDAYSFQIVTKIIDTIIPILVKDNHIASIAKVLRVFVDALLDVPEHRKMPLYKQLLNKIDVQENLYLFLLLVFESQVLHSNQEKQRGEGNPKRLEIAADLCREFTPDIVLQTCIKLIKHLYQLPDEKEDKTESDSESATFNITTHTPKDFRHYKYLILKFTANLLSSQQFVNQIVALNQEDELHLEDLYKELIVNILQYIQKTSKVAENAANTPQAQYWKVILHHSYDTLDSLNALVSPQMFLLVSKGLMVHSLSTVRRRILELLNTKLQYNSEFFAECKKQEIYTLIPPIINIIEGINNDVDPEQEIIIQTALLSLKLLVKSLAPEDPEKFVQILDFITNIINSGKAQNNVLASVLLCLAELCVDLKAHAIANLAEFMPAIIKILKQQKYEEIPSVLMKSIITTIEKIFVSMPLFLSPYLQKLLVELSILISKWGYTSDDQKIQPFVNKLTCIKQKIGAVIPPRVLIPAIEECYNKLIKNRCFSAISALMDILAESLTNLKGSDVNSSLPELTNFFLNALKFRTDGKSSMEEANTVEGHIVQAYTVLILKLSESTFRPLYYKLYDWAIRTEVRNERIITFYNLSSGMANSLKGLFVLFAGHFLNNAAEILDSCNVTKNEELYFKEENKNILVLEYVLKTINTVFLYGSHRFINKDRFDILMQPLVDQIENTLGGIDSLLKRNEELLTPCLVHFAVATGDDALWKQMNYQILLKMRHNVPKVRLIALHCLTEIVKKLGEDFLSLLPETIPFLAELLEDEEEDVEKACQKAVQEMEKVLGEPLQKYF